ncbi:MAG: ribbon-helix-helix domain-containing protein [Cellulosilyticaceae bacterium]
MALLNTLEELSHETRINKSKLVDEALELLFEKHNKQIIDEATE